MNNFCANKKLKVIYIAFSQGLAKLIISYPLNELSQNS